jgi:hypothetical protein
MTKGRVMGETNRKRLLKMVPIVFLFLLTIIFFHPVIFEDKTFYAFDTLFQYLPWSNTVPKLRAQNPLITDPVNVFYIFHHFLKTRIAEKTLPLWYDLNFSGVPYTSGFTPQSNPVVFLSYILFPLSAAHDLVLWIHMFGAGVFMFLFLRQVGLKGCPALIGAVSWMFNGYVMVWFEFEHIPILGFSLPATLYFFERWLRTRTWFHCLCCAAVIGLSICSGLAHIIIYQMLFLGFYFLYRIFGIIREKDNFPKTGRHDWIVIGAAILLIVFVSTNFIMSHLALLQDSQRHGIPFQELYQQTGRLPAKYLTTLIFPDFFGSPTRLTSFTPGSEPYNNYNELCIYTGILTLLLALVCLLYIRKKYIGFFFFSALITITMAMGSILYYPLWKLIPGLDFSTPSRILYLFGFSMSVLAAMGADILTDMDDKKKWPIFVLWALTLGLGVMVAVFAQTAAGARWAAELYPGAKDWDSIYHTLRAHFDILSDIIQRPLILMVASFGALCAILFSNNSQFKMIVMTLGLMILSCDLISFGLIYNTASPQFMEYPETDAIRFLKKDKSTYRIITTDEFMSNSFAPYGIADVGGYSSIYPKRYGEYLHLCEYGLSVPMPQQFSRWTHFRKVVSPLFDLINVKYVLLPPPVLADTPKLKLVYDKEIKIFENRDAFPRVFFVPSYQFCSTRKEAYETLSTFSTSDFREKVILEVMPPRAFSTDNNTLPTKANTNVDVIEYKPGKMAFDIQTDRRGFLVISDNYHPAWEAKKDGRPATVYRANYIMKAIPVEAGRHNIEVMFRPKGLILGITATALGWFVFGMLLLICTLRQIRIRLLKKSKSSDH